jgi:hypothetical protein
MIGFTGTSIQSQPTITAHNPWLPKTRSIPNWTTSVFSSTVTDLVLINKSATSSTTTALNDDCLMNPLTTESLNSPGNAALNSLSNPSTRELTLFYNLGRIEKRSPPRTVHLLFCCSVATKRSYRTVVQQLIISCLFAAARTRAWRAVG